MRRAGGPSVQIYRAALFSLKLMHNEQDDDGTAKQDAKTRLIQRKNDIQGQRAARARRFPFHTAPTAHPVKKHPSQMMFQISSCM